MAILEVPDSSLARIAEAKLVLQYVGYKCNISAYIFALQMVLELGPHGHVALFT